MKNKNIIISAREANEYRALIGHFCRDMIEDFNIAVTDAVNQAIERYTTDTRIIFDCDNDDVNYLLDVVKAAGYTIPSYDYTPTTGKLSMGLRFDEPEPAVRLNALSISAFSALASVKTLMGKRINSFIRNTFNPKVIEATKRGRSEVYIELPCHESRISKELKRIMESNGYIVESGMNMFENKIKMVIRWDHHFHRNGGKQNAESAN